MEQEQDDAHTQQKVADARDAGNGGAGAGSQRRAQYLENSANEEQNTGDIQTQMIHHQDPSGLFVLERKVLFQQEQNEEEEHPQYEVVGVHDGQCSLPGETVEFGEFPVENAAHHGDDCIEQRTVYHFFHKISSCVASAVAAVKVFGVVYAE